MSKVLTGDPDADPEPAQTWATLRLPVPTSLPTEIALDDGRKEGLGRVLGRFLSILADPDRTRRAEGMSALAADFAPGPASAVEIGATGIPAGREEVADFDRFFGVHRTAHADAASGLIEGLLQAAASMLLLVSRTDDLSEADIALQVEGFAAHARTLGRVFRLEALD